jgi:transcriptional repressor NrdR
MASPSDHHPSRRRSPPASAPGAATLATIIHLPDAGFPSSAGRSSVDAVRCPTCSSLDDKVVDSRLADDGSAIRRRRECVTCGRRYTTFERVEEVPLLVVKRSGDRVPFDRTKIEAGVRSAAKGRPVDDSQLAAIAVEVEEQVRIDGPEVPSERIGIAVLDRLRDVDQVAYVRFASVYKDFDDPADFQREIGLLTKQTAPKRHEAGTAPERP